MPRSLSLFCRSLGVIVAALALYRFCVLPWRINRVLHTVEARSRIALAVSDRERSAILARQSIDDLSSIAGASELDVNFHLMYASNARLLGRWNEALDHYNAALRADHRPEIYFQRGLTMLEMGNPDAAVADFVTTARFNPNLLDDMDYNLRERVRGLAGLK